MNVENSPVLITAIDDETKVSLEPQHLTIWFASQNVPFQENFIENLQFTLHVFAIKLSSKRTF